jgi:hypothetical protein
MIQRCTNPKRRGWKHYGGRGITVCERWLTFENFLADMGLRLVGTSLERIDNDKGYEPSNCIWADRRTQARNSKQVVWVEIKGVTKRLVEWCEELGMSINTVRARAKFHGFDYVAALTTPLQSNNDRAARGRFVRRPKR